MTEELHQLYLLFFCMEMTVYETMTRLQANGDFSRAEDSLYLLQTPNRRCLRRCVLKVNNLEQLGHWWALMLLCMFVWSMQCSLTANPLLHTSQKNRYIFKWTLLMWDFSALAFPKAEGHISHTKTLDWASEAGPAAASPPLVFFSPWFADFFVELVTCLLRVRFQWGIFTNAGGPMFPADAWEAENAENPRLVHGKSGKV